MLNLKKLLSILFATTLIAATAVGPALAVNPQANRVDTDTTNFDNNLSASDTTVQLALETLDEMSGGGVSDGDKGDITVSSSGAVWTVDADAITYSKIQDVSATNRILGRDTAGSGIVEEITPANLRTMLNVEDGAAADQDLSTYQLKPSEGAFVDGDKTKLDGIESSATADQTGAEIKSAYEGETDTNAFTDADHSKLDGIEASATADQTGAEIKAVYEAESNTNAFTDSEKTLLGNQSGTNTGDVFVESGGNKASYSGAVVAGDTSVATAQSGYSIKDTLGTDRTFVIIQSANEMKLGGGYWDTISIDDGAGIAHAFKQGKLGVNNTSPSATLDVTGTGAFSGALTASNLSGTNTGDQDLSGYMQDTDIDTFSELQSWVSDETLLKAGTLTDGKTCTYDLASTDIICNTTPSGGISNVVEDTTPQLGGTLDAEDNIINDTNNIIIGGTSVGTSGDNVLGINIGTVPSTSPADMVQIYATDVSTGYTADQIPTMTSNTAPTGTASASTEYSATYEAWKAFDDDVATYWISSTASAPRYLKYDFGLGNEVAITKANITNWNNNSYSPGGSTSDCDIEGSTNDSSWTGLYNLSGLTWSNKETKSFEFENETAYRYYRVNCTVVGTYTEMMEVEFLASSGTSAEGVIRDEADNITTLSPHNFKRIPKERRDEVDALSDGLAWTYNSCNKDKCITVDMFSAIREIEKLSGKKLIYSNANIDETEAEFTVEDLKEMHEEFRKTKPRRIE